tara:strand:- start:1254 stop:1679 length:426 start_codon:yes stop_codon:yes gene_type:complete
MDKYVKLKDLKGFDDEFLNALGELEQRIFESYGRFMKPRDGEVEHSMFTEFKNNFGYDTGGRKYLRLVTGAFGEGQTSVWGFIAKSDFEVDSKRKTGPSKTVFKEGDLLKSAGWKTPTLNAPRGNIFDENYNVQWTGPNYL